MQRYLLRRVLLLIPTLFGVTVVVFLSVRFLPGDVVDQILGDFGNASPEIRAQLEEQYSLNNSLVTQYVDWMGALFQGDMGTSILSGRTVGSELETRLPATFELGLLALIVSTAIALPVGIISAIRQDSMVDYAARSLAILMLAVPSFWLALMAITYGFIWFGWTPPLNYVELWNDPIDNLRLMWVPAIILGAAVSGTVMRLTRSMMLEAIRQDYVRTAWAKGLRERTIVLRHVLRNAMIPVVTVIGLQVPIIVGGTVILETIFSIPGMGSFLLRAINSRDYPVVQAIVLISAIVVLMANLLTDLTYSVLDPRIRYDA